MLRTLINDKRGTSALEYGILAGVIGAGAGFAAWRFMLALEPMFIKIGDAMQAVGIPRF